MKKIIVLSSNYWTPTADENKTIEAALTEANTELERRLLHTFTQTLPRIMKACAIDKNYVVESLQQQLKKGDSLTNSMLKDAVKDALDSADVNTLQEITNALKGKV